MEEHNYSELGMKCGLEIHQQLDTKKLFCNCESVLRKDEPEYEVRRRLHAVAGESGEIDEAAAYQASLNKEFVYQGYDSICLVELDEEPPHEINKEALKIAIEISLLLNCKIIPLTQIMRKTVIDGSNTSGFQRSVLIAEGGYVETEYGKVGIKGIFLEEDAARKISKDEDKVVFRLDRLGIPLVEIATEPDIKNPLQAKEVALHIGNVLRSCKVKRGLGTIRQDVNLSIRNGARTEIKGLQNPDIIIKTMNNEITRQLKLISSKEKVLQTVRKANLDGATEFLRPMPGSARMYPETDLPLLKIKKDFINGIKKNLPKLRSDVEEELKKSGLNQEMVKLIFKQNKLNEFRELLEVVNNPSLVAKVLLVFPKEIAKHENKSVQFIEKILNKDVLAYVLEIFDEKKITESQIKQVMMRIAKGENLQKAVIFESQETSFIEEKIHRIIKEKPGLSDKAYMGLVMKEFRGKVDGKSAMEIIRKFMK